MAYLVSKQVNTLMKLDEVLEPQQLDEVSLKHAAAAGILGLAALSPNKTTNANALGSPGYEQYVAQKAAFNQKYQEDQKEKRVAKLSGFISDRYNISDEDAREIVKLAHKYERPDFPRAEDILAIISIESSFNKDAVSKLRRDPARGLMQVRPGVWGIDKAALSDAEAQIHHGAQILDKYYHKLKDKEAAIRAYNIGLTHYLKGRMVDAADRYSEKFRTARERLSSVIA